MPKQLPEPLSNPASPAAARSASMDRQARLALCSQPIFPVMVRPVDLYTLAWQAAVVSVAAAQRRRLIAQSN